MVISNNSRVALQPLAVALTVTVPEIAAKVLLVLKNDGMFPLPEAAKPTPVFVFVQDIVAEFGETTTFVAGIFMFSQSTMSAIGVITGVGLMVIVKFTGEPIQVFKVGVTAIVPAFGIAPEFSPLKLPIFPEPVAPKPIEVILILQ